jgi:hypothetical protein
MRRELKKRFFGQGLDRDVQVIHCSGGVIVSGTLERVDRRKFLYVRRKDHVLQEVPVGEVACLRVYS